MSAPAKTGLVIVRSRGFYYYSTTTRASGLYIPMVSALQSREFDDLRRCGWRWTLTVAPVWACEAAPGKPVGNNLAKSKEAECSAFVVQRHGLEKIGWLLLSHRSFPEMSGITVNVEKT